MGPAELCNLGAHSCLVSVLGQLHLDCQRMLPIKHELGNNFSNLEDLLLQWPE